MSGAVAVHEDRGVRPAVSRTRTGESAEAEAGDADALRADTERYTDHAATSSVRAIYMHKLSMSGVIVRSPGLASG